MKPVIEVNMKPVIKEDILKALNKPNFIKIGISL